MSDTSRTVSPAPNPPRQAIHPFRELLPKLKIPTATTPGIDSPDSPSSTSVSLSTVPNTPEATRQYMAELARLERSVKAQAVGSKRPHSAAEDTGTSPPIKQRRRLPGEQATVQTLANIVGGFPGMPLVPGSNMSLTIKQLNHIELAYAYLKHQNGEGTLADEGIRYSLYLMVQLLRHSRCGAEQGVGRADGFERAAIGNQRCGLDGLWNKFPGEPLTAHSSRPLSTGQISVCRGCGCLCKVLGGRGVAGQGGRMFPAQVHVSTTARCFAYRVTDNGSI